MLRLSGITHAYDGRTVLEIGALEFRPGSFTAILGHNGSGKSTLMRLIAREIRPDGGTILLDGQPVARWRSRAFARRLAHLPQRLPEVPGLTVRDLVALGRYPWRGAFGRWGAADDAAVETALAETGMHSLSACFADEISGGERQRAWIAMLLAQEAPLLLLDEPIAALDPGHQVEVLRLLAQLGRERGRDVIAVLHDVNLAARFAERVIALKRGRVSFDGPPARLMDEATLSALYDTAIELVPRPGRLLPVAVPAEAA